MQWRQELSVWLGRGIDQSEFCITCYTFCAFQESCSVGGDALPLDMTAPHVIIILLLLIVIMVGMCAGMIYNLHRKLTEDKEDIIASRRSLASLHDSRATLGEASVDQSETKRYNC